MISFDASASSDPDGSIVEYQWDFDADGTTDWSTADASVPPTSSGGTVDTITPGASPGSGLPPTTVTAKYHQGYAVYKYPQVTVVDDKGGTATQTVKLGLTGWVRDLISSEDPAYDPPGQEVQFVVRSVGANPSTGEVACCGENGKDSAIYGGEAGSLCYAYRKSSGEWVQEVACGLDNPALASWDAQPSGYSYLAWQADVQPVIVFSAYKSLGLGGTLNKVLLAERQASGVWNVSLWLEGSGSINASIGQVRLLGPGRFMALGQLFQDSVYNFYLLTYDSSPQPPEDTGIVWHGAAGTDPMPQDLYVNTSGETCILMSLRAAIDPWGVNNMRRTAPGVWIPERLAECTEFPADIGHLGAERAFPQPDGSLRVVATPGIAGDTSRQLIGYASGNIDLTLQVLHEGYWLDKDQVHQTDLGISLFAWQQTVLNKSIVHDLISDSSVITEYVLDLVVTPTNEAIIWATGCGPDSRLYATLTVQGGSYPSKCSVFLATRVDPRIGP